MHILACDRFASSAECSKKIVKRNGYADKIRVLACDSSRLDGTEFSDKRHKPDIVVAELLDTELIGEGCLHTYLDLNQRLTGRNTLFVPARARIHVQLVQSEKLFAYHQFNLAYDLGDIGVEDHTIHTPKKPLHCFGSHMLHDMQINRLKPEVDFEFLTEPESIFKFAFNQPRTMNMREVCNHRFDLVGKIDRPAMIFLWWDLDMDSDAQVKLNCGPYWTRGFRNDSQVPWRDHWMQAIYYLPAFAFQKEYEDIFSYDYINSQRKLFVNAFHDPFSFWFDLPKSQRDPLQEPAENEFNETWTCNCGMHTNISRTRLAAINNIDTLRKYTKVFNELTANKQQLTCIFFGEQSLLPFALAHIPQVAQMLIIVKHPQRDRFFAPFLEANPQISAKVKILKPNEVLDQAPTDLNIDWIVSDMFFSDFSNDLPALKYFDCLEKFSSVLGTNVQAFPGHLVVKCCLAEFRDYWRCFAKVGKNVNGFDLRDYDRMIENARSKSDHKLEPTKCWEYSSKAISETKTLWRIPLHQLEAKQFETVAKIDLTHLGKRLLQTRKNRWSEKIAVVLWLEQEATDGEVVNNMGAIECNFPSDKEIQWNREAMPLIGFLGERWGSSVVKTQKDENKVEEGGQLEKDVQFDQATLSIRFTLDIDKSSKKKIDYEIV